VVFVHAVSGSALPFLDVADHLGAAYSRYGLQTRQYDDGDPVPSLVDLAAEHVAAVEEIRGLSPVYLVGWSMGGCVALEMARRWLRQGVKVAGLVLLDSWLPPAAVADPDDRTAAEKALRAIALDDLEHAAAVLADDPAELERLRRTVEVNSAAYLDYVPAALDVQAHLMRAAELPDGVAEALPELYRSPALGWEQLLSSVEVRSVPGNHYTLVRPEHAPVLADALRQVLEADDQFGEL
jgi:thioesterase domain-containing protein